MVGWSDTSRANRLNAIMIDGIKGVFLKPTQPGFENARIYLVNIVKIALIYRYC